MLLRTELEIVWEGDVKGLPDKRLSLAEFGPALTLLIGAARRIASNMITNALERSEVGRLSSAAKQLDIEIQDVKHNSSGLSTVLTFEVPGSTPPLFNLFTENVGTELLRSIDYESKGILRDSSVRKYVRSLPTGLTRQSYRLHENGRTIQHVEIGTVKLPELPEDIPSLREIEGHISGVAFEAGKQEVRFRADWGTAAFSATEHDVDKAIELRHQNVRILGVHDGKRGRILRVEPSSQSRFQVTREAIEEHIFKRWDGVFARLAR